MDFSQQIPVFLSYLFEEVSSMFLQKETTILIFLLNFFPQFMWINQPKAFFEAFALILFALKDAPLNIRVQC